MLSEILNGNGMRHDFNDYVAFMTVAQECSFSRAAVRLGISASTLSHTIRRLEERVGMPLLMRTTRRVAVTEAGKQLLLTLEPGLARIEAGVTALQRLRHTPAGLVRLTVSDHMIHECLWPRLSPLLKKYSDIKVEMSQQNGFVDIVEGNFDAGVRIGDDILKDMVAVRIAPDIRFVVIGSSTYLAERGLPLHPSQLEKHDCINIRLSPTGPLYGWEFVRQGEIVKKVDGQLTFSSIYPMLQAVKDGYGLAYLPESSALAGIEAGHYCRVLEDWSEAFPADMIIPIMSITGSGKDNTDTLHEKGKSNITCCAPDFKNERFT
uniref:Transcriptional regulator n=1 Tax=Enterobacter hormaechei subsp. xiangfangensis TaxID=1296536 RepID=A0A7I8HQ92_9ENTR|nr:LysR family transcriptional regulator [Enterobacter hormaechei]BCM22926.1 transcriptional regulator [Enterobacter hormaechei subsp. xiangfangensis]BCM23276.1 transcriptional regulator [Enterobacter hormaechei subsp. xiangfangensis]